MKKIVCIFISALALCMFFALPLSAKNLPKGLVYLRNVAPTIIQDMRYATPDNFTGEVVPGYNALHGECALKKEAAKRLAELQNELAIHHYSLKVFDCYRPQSAVEQFVKWVDMKPNNFSSYNPHFTRKELLRLGYISRRSSHTRGTAVDLTITSTINRILIVRPKYAKNDPCGKRDLNSIALDMGTGFDCFDKRSHTNSSAVTLMQYAYRQWLKDMMELYGFRNYHKEWWHFTLVQ